MCRVLAYLGPSMSVEKLLFSSDNSLVNQVFQPKMLAMLNLAGFGMIAWDPDSRAPDTPWRYHSTGLPMLDHNLRAISSKVYCHNLLAHIRGVPVDGSASIGEQNLHPFLYPGMNLALAHNGDLFGFSAMRYALVPHISKEILPLIRGNTDSEWLYALLLSRLRNPAALHTGNEIAQAVQEVLDILRQVRADHDIDISSSVNLFISNPDCLVAVRFTFDYGCYLLPDQDEVNQGCIDYLSLWFTQGSNYACHDGEWKMVGGRESTDSIIIASEPLSVDTSTWAEVPEYHLLSVQQSGQGISKELIALE